MRAKTVIVGGKKFRKFIPYPQPVTDGTVRCVVCGQIDEPEYHDDSCCPAIAAPRLTAFPAAKGHEL